MATYKYTLKQRIASFWAKVDTSGGMFACWEWTAYRDKDGYGQFFWEDGRQSRAHRISWMLAHGEIPEGMLVLHNCPDGDNPSCVNPAHLWLGTQQENREDCGRKGRNASGKDNGSHTRPERRPKGHQHGNAKLTESLVREMRQRYAQDDINQTRLAQEYGISQTVVSKIIRNEAWKHI